ncbi:MAG: DUF4062 domain-containing protein [Nitrospirota bacterium]|nr:DUF4062 domain-containing protein [Nitrospirota bacterium]MDH5775191.1 DUF4062 domain-containing protein [Nitrospirota bacterium]
MPSTYGRLHIFVSSSMAELAEERAIIKEVVEQFGYEPFLYEQDALARPGNHEATFIDELQASHLYVGIFWKKYGKYTVQEFEQAKNFQLPRLVFEKKTQPTERDEELQAFLDRYNKATNPDGETIARFHSGSDLREKFHKSFSGLLAEGFKKFWKSKEKTAEGTNAISPKILPCLCDRDEQEADFLEAILALRQDQVVQPFLWLLPGYKDEAHWLYVVRMREFSLKKHFPPIGGKDKVKVIEISYPLSKLTTSEQLGHAILNDYPLDITLNDESLLKIAKEEGFQVVLVVVKLLEEESHRDWSNHLNVVSSYLQGLSAIPHQVRIGVMVCLLKETPLMEREPVWTKTWKKLASNTWGDGGMQEKFAALDREFKKSEMLSFKGFDFLKPPKIAHVQEWNRREEVNVHLPMLSHADIRKNIFHEKPHLHMEDLNIELQNRLNK